MIPRPTTDELIADCCRELTEHVLPALATLTDETLVVRVAMVETVLRNAAVRAAHEIAWMRKEAAAFREYARTVAAADSSDSAGSASLHLADVVADYERAGRDFETALAVAQEAGDDALVAQARELLAARIDTEKQIMATYAVVGR